VLNAITRTGSRTGQTSNNGFKIGLLNIGLGKRGAEVSEIIDDKINGLIVIGRYDRRGPISAHEKTPNAKEIENLSTKWEKGEPQQVTAPSRDSAFYPVDPANIQEKREDVSIILKGAC
jgi:hypothetical protein